MQAISTTFLLMASGKENAKMTGDRMKMLMLTLPFMVRDLIAPEVHSALHSLTLHICILLYIQLFTCHIMIYTLIYQVKLINAAKQTPVCAA